MVDGDYQNYKAKDGAFVREHFFNSPELKEMVKAEDVNTISTPGGAR